MYSISGLIPENITLNSIDEGLPLIRKMISDDYYFNHKAYVMCYCEHTDQPYLPSQKHHRVPRNTPSVLSVID